MEIVRKCDMELGNCMEIVWKCSMELENRMEIVQKCSVELRNCMEMAWNLEFMWKYHGNNMEIKNNIEILQRGSDTEIPRKFPGTGHRKIQNRSLRCLV